MNCSRRKATQPLPPSPLLVKIFASSRNFMGSASGSTDGLEAAHENGGMAAHSPVRERRYRDRRAGLLGGHLRRGRLDDGYGGLAARLAELHLALHHSEQRVVPAHAAVTARVALVAALTAAAVSGQHAPPAHTPHPEAPT